MAAGLERPDDAQVIADRGEAIRAAVEESGPGDIVLVAGKGHEDYQETAGQKLAFSDEDAIREVLEEAA